MTMMAGGDRRWGNNNDDGNNHFGTIDAYKMQRKTANI